METNDWKWTQDRFIAEFKKLDYNEKRELHRALYDCEQKAVKRVSVRSGQIVRYVTEGSFMEKFERVGMSCDNYDNVTSFSVIEYLAPQSERIPKREKGCYRTSNVSAEKVIEITDDFVDLSLIEFDHRPISYEEFKEVIEKNRRSVTE